MRKSDKSNTFLNLGLTERVFFLSWSPVHTQSFFPYLAFHLTYCYHIVCLNHNHINKLTLNNARCTSKTRTAFPLFSACARKGTRHILQHLTLNVGTVEFWMLAETTKKLYKRSYGHQLTIQITLTNSNYYSHANI